MYLETNKLKIHPCEMATFHKKTKSGNLKLFCFLLYNPKISSLLSLFSVNLTNGCSIAFVTLYFWRQKFGFQIPLPCSFNPIFGKQDWAIPGFSLLTNEKRDEEI